MLKKVLFSLTLASIVGSASAQGLLGKRVTRFNNKGAEKNLMKTTVSKPMKKTAWVNVGCTVTPSKVSAQSPLKADASKNIWFDYSEGTNGLSLGGYGFTQYDLAMLVPAKYANAKVDSVSILFFDRSKLSDVCYWFQSPTDGSLYYPSSGTTATVSYAIDTTQIKSAVLDSATNKYKVSATELKLPQTFTIPTGGCLAGYSLTTAYNANDRNDNGNYPIVTYTGNDNRYGFLLHAEGTWYNQYGSGDGNITMALHLDLTDCKSTSVTCNGVVEAALKVGTESTISVNVTNDGLDSLTSVGYILSVDGVASAEQTMQLSDSYKIDGGTTSYLYIPYTSTEGEHLVSVEITKVNGEKNTATNTSASAYVLGLTTVADRVSVVEEGTSTSCGYCPRGTVGLEKVKEALGDKVVALSVHGKQSSSYDDPMTCSDYAYFLKYFISGYPEAIINRVESADPYAGFYDNYEVDATGEVSKIKFGLDKAVTTVDALYPSEGSVAMTAKLSTEEKKVTVNTSTTFNVDRETAPYSLLFVLTEDGMTGTDNGTNLWSQYNYYSQSFINAYYNYYGQDVSTAFTDTDMDTYKNGAYKYAETYNNVVVGAWSGTVTQNGKEYPTYGLYGIAAFEDQDIVAGEAKAYDTTLDLSSNTMIQNYNNLKLAVLLLNDNNGMIVNAAQVKLVDPAGIEGAVKDNNNSAVVARYSIDGRKLDAPVKGLNIVKTADGRSMKVLVK